MFWYEHEIDHHFLFHEENGYVLLWKPQQLTFRAGAAHANQKLLLPPAQGGPSFLPEKCEVLRNFGGCRMV